MHPRRLCILGVGLLGGSIGLAVRSRLKGTQVTGYAHRQATLDTARRIGAVDEAYDQPGSAVRGADLVVLCTPVGMLAPLLQKIAGDLSDGVVVTDVGSTKQSVVVAARSVMPRNVHFVGSHPMAGSEKRGVEFARADLFDGANCITTPTSETNPSALAQVEAFWKAIGMTTIRLAPDEHDRLLSDVSHLPHAVAAALVSLQSDASIALCGKGFLDSTRVAGGDGGLWRDIFLDNRENLQTSIGRLILELQTLQQSLKNGDGDRIEFWLKQAASRREKAGARKS